MFWPCFLELGLIKFDQANEHFLNIDLLTLQYFSDRPIHSVKRPMQVLQCCWRGIPKIAQQNFDLSCRTRRPYTKLCHLKYRQHFGSCKLHIVIWLWWLPVWLFSVFCCFFFYISRFLYAFRLYEMNTFWARFLRCTGKIWSDFQQSTILFNILVFGTPTLNWRGFWNVDFYLIKS